MKSIGITGGFCSGKTTAALFFKGLGAHVIDADKIVHELYRKDKKIKEAVLKSFGRKVFTGDRIDRKKLGQIAFGSRGRLKKLCKIVYPETIKTIKGKARKSGKQIVIIDVPLLIESGLHKTLDAVVVVKAPLGAEIRRAAGRGFTKKDFLSRRRAQITPGRKLKFADFVIDNNKTKRDLKKEATKIWRLLKRR